MLTSAEAQIGATKEEMATRYGVPKSFQEALTEQYDAVVDEYYVFKQDKLEILAGFKAGHAVFLMYFPILDREKVNAILDTPATNAKWILLSGSNPSLRWALPDKSAYAYYDPHGLLRIHTAPLDEIYTQIRENAEYKASVPSTTGTTQTVSDDLTKPLLQIFASRQSGSQNPGKLIFDGRKPLLSVYTVHDLILFRDKKGVMLGLNNEDRKAFAALTRKYNGKTLILQTGDKSITALHILAPMMDGYIGFKYPVEAKVAEYLRRRFHLAEFH